MKRNPSKRIAIALLVLFTCAFSVQNFAAIARNFKIELSTVFSGKVFKTVPVSPDCPINEESLGEAETEDESETQFSPLAFLTVMCWELFTLEASQSYGYVNADPGVKQETSQPRYLVTRTFRI